MTVTAIDKSTHETVDRTELRRRAEAITPLARENAARTERDCKVVDEVMEALVDARFHRAIQPKAYGGWELGFESMIDVSSILGRGCVATAWCAGLYMAHGWLATLFPEETHHDLWGDGPDVLMCGSYAPAGKAIPVDGGYRLSGRFSFSSGSPHADWSLCGALIPKPEGDGFIPAFMMVPKSDYVIDWDSWNTVGMAGTGSYDLLLDDVFIPAHRVLTFLESGNSNAPGALKQENPIYRMATLACVPFALSTPAVGAAQGALDLFLEQNRARETRGAVVLGGKTVSDYQTVQKRVGEAEALIEAALAVAYRAVEGLQDEARATGGGTTMDRRMKNRRAQAFMTRQAVTAVDLIFDAVGGRGLQMDHPIQRAWRDVHAINAHISLNYDAVMSMVGQFRFGLEPDGQY